jgi:hypothetical protein
LSRDVRKHQRDGRRELDRVRQETEVEFDLMGNIGNKQGIMREPSSYDAILRVECARRF